MADIIWSDVMDVPGATNDGFGSVTAGWQTQILTIANTQLDPDAFGGVNDPIYKTARCLLACHYTAFAKLGMNGIAVLQSEGGVTQQYALPPFDKSRLMFTGYGLMLLSLMNAAYGGPTVL
jgi:hypothetical protein